MLTDRAKLLDNAPMLRELLGEVRDPKELFLRTIDGMASTMASQRLYDSIASSGIKPFAQATARARPRRTTFCDRRHDRARHGQP
jgi:hypothetical protein